MFIRLLRLDRGGEKYLKFAKSKAHELKEAGAVFSRKTYPFPDATVSIMMMQDYADIRISVSKPQAVYWVFGNVIATVVGFRFGTYSTITPATASLKQGILSTAGPGTNITSTEAVRVVKTLMAAGYYRLAADFVEGVQAFATPFVGTYQFFKVGNDFRVSRVSAAPGAFDTLFASRTVVGARNAGATAFDIGLGIAVAQGFFTGNPTVAAKYQIAGGENNWVSVSRKTVPQLPFGDTIPVLVQNYSLDADQHVTLGASHISSPTAAPGSASIPAAAWMSAGVLAGPGITSGGLLTSGSNIPLTLTPGGLISYGGFSFPGSFTGNTTTFSLEHPTIPYLRSITDDITADFTGKFLTGPTALVSQNIQSDYQRVGTGLASPYWTSAANAVTFGLQKYALDDYSQCLLDPQYSTLIPIQQESAALYDTATKKFAIFTFSAGWDLAQSNYMIKKFGNALDAATIPGSLDSLKAAMAACVTVVYDGIGTTPDSYTLLQRNATTFAV